MVILRRIERGEIPIQLTYRTKSQATTQARALRRVFSARSREMSSEDVCWNKHMVCQRDNVIVVMERFQAKIKNLNLLRAENAEASIFYVLSVEAVQEVAMSKVKRKLETDELNRLKVWMDSFWDYKKAVRQAIMELEITEIMYRVQIRCLECEEFTETQGEDGICNHFSTGISGKTTACLEGFKRKKGET